MNTQPTQITAQPDDLPTTARQQRRGPDLETYLKLPHAVIVRAPGLLPMLYSPSEIEEELGIDARAVREWITRGLLHERDERGHIWINGRQLAEWVKANADLRKQPALQTGEAYCLRCNTAVNMLDSIRLHQGKRTFLQGVCPVCGTQIYRGIKHGQSN